VVDGVLFEVDKGCMLVIVGEFGFGKSVMSVVVMGLYNFKCI